MAKEHKGLVTFKGGPLTLVGDEVKVGDTAPDFHIASSLADFANLSDSKGKVRVLNVVPSLDTGVCDKQTREFDKIAGQIGDGVLVLTISMDLPPGQGRWATEAGVEHIKTLSDYRSKSFGNQYGVLIKELDVLARSVWVVDKGGKVAYKQIVPETTTEPDYAPVVEAVKKLL
ncbi:MAG: thiol peroxidase [Candidatus Poribacteria bacterium]|nr:thiol peroxidase [Candidatus Poribacteria bacterium]